MRTSLLRLPYWLLSLAMFIFCSCKGQHERQELTRLVQEWQGREVLLPDNMAFSRYVHDTVNYDVFGTPFKLLHYVDTVGCFSCKLRLRQWSGLIEELRALVPGRVAFLLCLSPGGSADALDRLESVLDDNAFDYPVFIDSDDRLNKMNGFPKRNGFQTFLLDKDNRVVAIGNPVHNERVKSLYLDYLTGKRTPEALGITKVSVSPVSISAGSWKLGEEKTYSVKIRNRGRSVFELQGLYTSCDCTEAIADWKRLLPGKSEIITVRVRPDTIGEFEREIYIEGNMASPIVINFHGTVVE